MGLVFATFRFKDVKIYHFFENPSYLAGFAVLMLVGFVIVRIPLTKAGNPDDPAPPQAMM